ncbi:hypothetical protein C8Q80DRAFT_1113575 [Daedaleopsis nitida]|nr:hypothetical protein C8Q80DRAFT_1113575 [Daedaleopsis nitida]
MASIVADVRLAFLLYDYAITFGQEVELFWRRKTNTGTILYFASRYLALVWYTINVIGSVSMSDKVWVLSAPSSCELFVKSIAIIRYAQYLPWAMFSALRALALSQQWSLAVLVLLLSLVPFAINITSYSFGATGVNVPPFGCSEIDSVSPALAQNHHRIKDMPDHGGHYSDRHNMENNPQDCRPAIHFATTFVIR